MNLKTKNLRMEGSNTYEIDKRTHWVGELLKKKGRQKDERSEEIKKRSKKLLFL